MKPVAGLTGIAGKMFRIVRPTRDLHYLGFIRRFPCVACKTERRQREAMHTGPRGMGQKSSDETALPGCAPCHRELHTIGSARFQHRHKIDFAELQAMFQGFYQREFPNRIGSPDGPSSEGAGAGESGMGSSREETNEKRG